MYKISVLIVENELAQAETTKATLEKRGHLVTDIATNEEEVFDSIDANMPEIILMDIRLDNGLEGIDIAKNIRKLNAIPIIYITDLNDDQVFQKAKLTFPKYYITKPFTPEMLIRAVELTAQDFQIGFYGIEHSEFAVRDGVFFYNKDKTYTKVFLKDIRYIEADSSYTDIHYGNDQKLTVSIPSNRVVAQLAYPSIMSTQILSCQRAKNHIHTSSGWRNNDF